METPKTITNRFERCAEVLRWAASSGMKERIADIYKSARAAGTFSGPLSDDQYVSELIDSYGAPAEVAVQN